MHNSEFESDKYDSVLTKKRKQMLVRKVPWSRNVNRESERESEREQERERDIYTRNEREKMRGREREIG